MSDRQKFWVFLGISWALMDPPYAYAYVPAFKTALGLGCFAAAGYYLIRNWNGARK